MLLPIPLLVVGYNPNALDLVIFFFFSSHEIIRFRENTAYFFGGKSPTSFRKKRDGKMPLFLFDFGGPFLNSVFR